MSSFAEGDNDAGLRQIQLRNRLIELTILPEAGGKIFDLIDRRSGRNWLWHNSQFEPSRARTDSDFYSEQDSGGWDEVLLSVKPANLPTADGRNWQVPDHGDVIGRRWRIVDLTAEKDGDAICSLTVAGTDISYELTRIIRLLHEQPKIELSYFLSNNGKERLPFYWCAHPLFAVEDGYLIDLPGSPRLRVDDEATRRQCASDIAQQWPMLRLIDGTSRDLSRSLALNEPVSGFASKVFMPTEDFGAARLRAPDSDEYLSISFDPGEVPWLGLWINNRGWSGCGSKPYRNIGIEPATSPYDGVEEAIRNDAVPWLQPGEVRSWSLLVELSP